MQGRQIVAFLPKRLKSLLSPSLSATNSVIPPTIRNFTTTKHLYDGNSAALMGKTTNDQVQLIDIKLHSYDQDACKVHPLWLRDHCRCTECYNHVTHQRNFDILKLDEQIAISSHSQDADNLFVEWSDGHKSTFSVSWLLNNTYEGKICETYQQPFTWDGTTVTKLNLDPLCHRDVMENDDRLSEVYQRVVRYGFAKIENVPPTKEDTETILERVCRASRTVFGMHWETGTNFDHKDTGYLNGYLEAHTDNTYFSEAQGLIAFHCTHFCGTGGESLLVDGFHVADQLKAFDPKAYHYLSNVNVPAEYIEPGEHFSAWGPYFRHHPITRRLEQVRLNVSDRAPLSGIPQTEIGDYYHHLKTLASLVRRKENEYWFRLSPGNVVIIDNWRLLHGRASFVADRVLRGCYYTRSDFMSRARHFGVVP